MTQMLMPTPGTAPTAWTLLLVANRQVDGEARRISLVGDDLEGFVHQGGEWARLALQTPTGPLFRDCTIVGFDADELRLDLAAGMIDDPAIVDWTRFGGIGDAVLVELIEPDMGQLISPLINV